MENGNGMEKGSGNGNNQRKMPDEGYNVIIQIKFYSVMYLGNVAALFR